MIYSIQGELELLTPADSHFLAVIDCGGIGYEIRTTMTTASQLKQGGKTKLYTYLNVREDAVELFGFFDTEERNCFKMLISVSGVGPKAALSILSNVTPSQFALCVASGDSKSLTRAKGIGAKIAQRIVLELKDKISNEQLAGGVTDSGSAAVLAGSGNTAEAVSALVVLGYSKTDAVQALSSYPADTPVEELIKAGLKALASFR